MGELTIAYFPPSSPLISAWIRRVVLEIILWHINSYQVHHSHKHLYRIHFLHINSRSRSHNIDRRPVDPRHYRLAAHPLGGRILLVASQAIPARVCRAQWQRERDEQRKLEVPAAAREPTAGAVAARTAEAAAAAATSRRTTEQHQPKTQRIPQPQDAAHRVSRIACACVNISHFLSVPKNCVFNFNHKTFYSRFSLGFWEFIQLTFIYRSYFFSGHESLSVEFAAVERAVSSSNKSTKKWKLCATEKLPTAPS